MFVGRILFAEAKKGAKKGGAAAAVVSVKKGPVPAQSSPRWETSRWNPEHWKLPPWNLYNCIRCLPKSVDSTGFERHKNGVGLMFYRRRWQTPEPSYWTITKNRIPIGNHARGIWGILTWRGQAEPRQRRIREASLREWWQLKNTEGWTREPHVKRLFFPEEARADLIANLAAKKAKKAEAAAKPAPEYPPNRKARRAASKGRGKAAAKPAAAPAAPAAAAKKKEK